MTIVLLLASMESYNNKSYPFKQYMHVSSVKETYPFMYLFINRRFPELEMTTQTRPSLCLSTSQKIPLFLFFMSHVD